MSSSSKFSHHNDYPRLHWLIPLWLLLLHHHSFACFNSISNFSSRSFFNSHVSVFSDSILSKLFFLFFFLSYMIIGVIFSFYILLRRRCRFKSHSSCHQLKGYHQLWKRWCTSLIMSLIWIVKMNGMQFIATFISIWYSFLILFNAIEIFSLFYLELLNNDCTIKENIAFEIKHIEKRSPWFS